MRKILFFINESQYAEQLLAYIREEEKEWDVSLCTNQEALQMTLQQSCQWDGLITLPDLLNLVHEEEINIRCRIVLVENHGFNKEGWVSLEQYQPLPVLMSEIYKTLGIHFQERDPVCPIWTIFSASGGAGKTTVALHLLLIASWTDCRNLRIYNWLTIPFLISGILYHAFLRGKGGIFFTLMGIICGFIPLFILRLIGGIGGGDVKWFSAFGAWAGPSLTIQLMQLSILFGGIFALMVLTCRLPGLRKIWRKIPWPWGKHPLLEIRNTTFPFMLVVLPSMIFLIGKG